ncbi:lyase family protein [Bradyrhizobium sp. 2TAF36]|uniref:lyase family protein n=1 Tax=Bradyrhizobium sp. 2TAF36 TaxID=3233016 RepID=UPI003F8F725E
MTSLPPQPLSPLDGRYRSTVSSLADYLSEAGSTGPGSKSKWNGFSPSRNARCSAPRPLSPPTSSGCGICARASAKPRSIGSPNSRRSRGHDVKAVEYLVREWLEQLGLGAIGELTHFACTGDDINSAAYALIVKRAVTEVWLPKLHAIIGSLTALAASHRSTPMLARTHGQPATPTTMGKEIGVFAWRLKRVAK